MRNNPPPVSGLQASCLLFITKGLPTSGSKRLAVIRTRQAIEDRGAIPLVAGPKEVQRGTSNERETIGKAHAVPPVPLVTKTAAMPGVRDFICSRANRSLRGLQAAPDYRISVFVTGNGFAHGHSVEW